MAYAKAKDGCMLYYKDWGQGDPVVLLHGWPLSADTGGDEERIDAEASQSEVRTEEPAY